MQSIVSIVVIIGILARVASSMPVDKLQKQHTPYSVLSPPSDATIFTGHNTAISWVRGEEDHINIDLAPASSPITTRISVAQDVSSANGTYIITVPDVVENCAQWKIGVSRNNESIWSEPIYISTNGTSCYTPATTTEIARPSASMAAEQAGGATMSASIDILGPDGQPIDKSSSSGSVRSVSFNASGAFVLGALILAVISVL